MHLNLNYQIFNNKLAIIATNLEATRPCKRKLIAFLRENVDLFTWSPTNKSNIDPKVACHQLVVNLSITWVAHRRWIQSSKMAKAIAKMIANLIDSNFI